MGHWRAVAAAAAITAAAGVAGCGSDEPERLSSAQFRQQADAICTRAADAKARVRYPTRLAGFTRWGEEVTAIHEQAMDELAELVPPEADEAAFGQLQATIADLSASTARGAELVAARDDAAVRAISELNARQARRAQELSAGLGIEACGQV